MTDFESRERLISCILTMRSLALSSFQGTLRIDRLKIFQDSSLDPQQHINGYVSLDCGNGSYNKQIAQDYETNLLIKLSSQVKSVAKETRELDNTVEEILINATFTSLQGSTQI